MNFLGSAPSGSDDAGTQAFLALIKLIADPKAVAKRVDEITAAQLAAVDDIAAAKAAQEKLEADRAAHDEQLKTERDQHDRALAEAKAKCAADCGAAMDEVRAQKENAAKLFAQAKTDSEAAAALRSDLQKRVAAIKSAVTA
jgi:hypothetical protein